VGWFLPEQIGEIEKHFKKPIAKLIGNILAVDYWVGGKDGGKDILVLCPNFVGNDGKLIPFSPYGRCVFYNERKECDIYEIRPYECRWPTHDFHGEENDHEIVAHEWSRVQNIFDELEIEVPEASLFDVLNFMKDGLISGDV
jgi:Fe-S-cluster containining protein